MSDFQEWYTVEVEDRLYEKEPNDIAEAAFKAGMKVSNAQLAKLMAENERLKDKLDFHGISYSGTIEIDYGINEQ